MNCCTQCFHDKKIIDFINRKGADGTCDYCNSQGVKTTPAEKLAVMFHPLLNLYEPDDPPEEEQTSRFKGSLADAIFEWDVFADSLPTPDQN